MITMVEIRIMIVDTTIKVGDIKIKFLDAIMTIHILFSFNSFPVQKNI